MGVFHMILRSKKRLIIILAVLNMLFSFGMSFAFWASEVSGDQNTGSSSITLGDWYDGTPIYTADEFIQVVTTHHNTNRYVLARDIDFQNLSYPAWVNNDNIVFQGILDGNGKTISNITKTNIRGIFGVLQGATVKNLTIENIHINYAPSGSISSGILAGRIQGTGNSIENIRIKNSTGTNTVYTVGTIAGLVQPATGDTTTVTATISNIKITSTSLEGAFSNNTYGSGGVIGTVINANLTMSDLYVEAAVSTNTVSNIGGIIGATLATGTVTINRAVIFSDLSNTSNSADANLGTAAIVGRNQGSITANDTFYSGFLRSYVLNPGNNTYTVQSGILRAIGNNVTFTNARSAQITIYRRSSNPSVLVNSSTLYNKMTGQIPTFSTAVYQTNRSSLNQSWWTSNYSNITNLVIWEYNATTFLYQLKD
jgi:hypothetical protein